MLPGTGDDPGGGDAKAGVGELNSSPRRGTFSGKMNSSFASEETYNTYQYVSIFFGNKLVPS